METTLASSCCCIAGVRRSAASAIFEVSRRDLMGNYVAKGRENLIDLPGQSASVAC
jgi:hypothetical protein